MSPRGDTARLGMSVRGLRPALARKQPTSESHMNDHFSAWKRSTAVLYLGVLCAVASWSVAGHAQEAAPSAPAASAVPAALRGAWLGEEANSRQGRDWVALIVHDDGEVDWYNDLPAKEVPTGTSGRKPTRVEAIGDSHLALSFKVTARNERLRNQTVVSTIVLDLKDGQLVGHREFPLDQDRAIVLSRTELRTEATENQPTLPSKGKRR